MDDRMERQLSKLHRTIGALEDRVARLEKLAHTGFPAPESPGSSPQTPAGAPAETGKGVSRSGPQTGTLIGFTGRTLLVLAGAFLLRAVTEAGILARFPGSLAGLAYAMFWIALADRAAAKSSRTSATVHGLTACLIAFPLLGEAVYRYSLISAGVGAVSVALAAGVFLLVAWHRTLHGLGWMAAGGAAITSVGLAVLSGAWIPFGYTLLVLSVFTLGLHYSRNWYVLAWCAGFTLNLLVAIEILLALLPGSAGLPPVPPGSLTTFLILLVLVHAAVFGIPTLVRGRSVRAFEIMQSTGVILVGVVGAVLTSRAAGQPTAVPALLSLLLAAGAYAVAFLFVDRRVDRKTNFLYYTTLALPLTLIAAGVLLGRDMLATVCAGLAVITASLGGHFSRVTLSLHSAVYVLVAVIASGLAAASIRSFLEAPRLDVWSSASLVAAFVAAGICSWITAAVHGRTWGRMSRAPKVIVLAALVWSTIGLVVAVASSLLPWGEEVDAGMLATLRTGVLAATALALGGMARIHRLSEARWLTYPVLAVGGLKLVLDDFPHGRPTTLFLSLALLGTALVMAPRLARRTHPMHG
jgi:hypothetical protein